MSLGRIKTTFLDKIFSKYVRARDNFTCQHCGKTSGLMDCAHIHSRRHLGTRWDEWNAVCLCRGCHMMFTTEPLAWAEWVKTIRTEYQLYVVASRARSVTKFTAADRMALYRDFKAKLEKMK